MATTKLTSLTLRGFRSFADEATIRFPENGLVLIRGKSLDTPGVSSGSGKSSIFLALSHALGYCPFPATELQSWLTKTPMEVSLGIKTKDGDATVTRGTKTTFTLGKETITGAKPTDERLQSLLGLDSELLSALTYRPQQTRGLFLSKTNAEMQDFLSILLGMDKYEDAIAAIQAKVKTIPIEIDNQEKIVWARQDAYLAVMQQPTMEVVDLQEFRRLCKETTEATKVVREAAATAKAKYNAKAEEVNALLEEVERESNEKLKNLGAFKEPSKVIDTHDVDYWQAAYLSAEERLDKLQKKIAAEVFENQRATQALQQKCWDANEQLKKIPTIRAEIDAIRMHECPRCHQQWDVGNADEIEGLEEQLARMVELEVDLKSWKVQLEAMANYQFPPELKEMQDVLAMVKEELVAAKNKVQLQQATHAAEVGKLKAEWNEKRAVLNSERLSKCQAIKDKHQPVLDALMQTYTLVENEVLESAHAEATAVKALHDAEKRNKEAEVFNAKLASNADNLKASQRQEQQKLDMLKAELASEQDLLLMLRGFMAKIFDEVLAEIAWNTNQMLGSIPNVSHVSIGFRSETVTLKGTTKKSITPYLMIDGKERPLRSALSGGMLAAIELAVDLAVRTVISARSGHTPGWLVLDECFEGLGVTEKEACMALLAQAAKDTLILVIDHSNEFKELFTATIDVENKGGRSTIAA